MDPHPARSSSRPGFPWSWLVPLTGGTLLRLVMLYGSVEIPAIRDEAHYLRLATDWSLFGTYTSVRPPGYPYFLAVLIDAFGVHGPTLAKTIQVLLCPLVGLATMVLARRLFGPKAALIAGAIWAGYLPLIGFSHMFWPESLFLVLFAPTLALFSSYLHEPDSPQGLLRLLACGLLAGLTMLLKDSAVVVPPLLGLFVAQERLRRRRSPVGRLSVLGLAVLVVIFPWILRNRDVYQRLAPPGNTIGMNFTVGMNGRYMNWDYGRGEIEQAYPADSRVRRWLLEPQDETWQPSENPNLIGRSRENVRSGLGYMAARPGFFVRTRIKKLADLVCPTSFVARHARRGLYTAPLEGRWTRKAIVWLAMLSSAALMVLAWAGIALSPGRSWGWWLMLATCIGFAAPSLLNAMSRGRAPMLPALIVLASGVIAGQRQARDASPRQKAVFASGCVVLVLLWLLNLDGLRVFLENFRES